MRRAVEHIRRRRVLQKRCWRQITGLQSCRVLPSFIRQFGGEEQRENNPAERNTGKVIQGTERNKGKVQTGIKLSKWLDVPTKMSKQFEQQYLSNDPKIQRKKTCLLCNFHINFPRPQSWTREAIHFIACVIFQLKEKFPPCMVIHCC